jgi:FtsP/CotA-like multicopper oxidase with cupredoxin domain
MKRISFLYFPLSIIVVFCSCQKVINVKLNPGAEAYVIEGVITNQPGYCTVSITQTKDFSSDNTFPGVSGATVTVENDGVVTTLAETPTGSGNYSTSVINGQPGQTYTLHVSVGGSVFTSSSTMPQPVGLDSIYVSRDQTSTKLYTTVVYSDPAVIKNYYRWVQYVNGFQEKTIFIMDDEFNDGLTVTNQLNFYNDDSDSRRDIAYGDSVRIDMLCIDSAVYKYWSSLQQSGTGSGNSASPANPVSNIKGGCLGYFSAQTIGSRTIMSHP